MSADILPQNSAKDPEEALREKSFSFRSFDLNQMSDDGRSQYDFSARLHNQEHLQFMSNDSSQFKSSLKNYISSDEFSVNDGQFSQKLRDNLRKLELDRTSQNISADYLDERGMFVSDWLAREHNINGDYTQPDGSKVSVNGEYQLGQVIGVRDSSNNANQAGRANNGYQFQRSVHNKLKFDHEKLKKEYGSLENQLRIMRSKYNHLLRRKNNDIDILKLLVTQTKKKRNAGQVSSDENHLLSSASEMNKLRNENNRLQVEAANFKGDLMRLADEIRSFKSDPVYRKLAQVQIQNNQLKERIELDMREFSELKQNFVALDERLKLITNEQQCAESERNDEVSKTMNEFHQIQAEVAALKMSLNNELEMKQELSRQLKRLEEERASLNEQLDSCRIDLSLEKSRSRKDESSQVEKLIVEANKWRDKFEQMKEDKSGLEDLLRNSKLRCNQLDSNHQNELELIRDLNRLELGKLNGIKLKLEEENRILKVRVEEEEIKRGHLEINNLKLGDEFLELKKQLEIVLIDKARLETTSSKLEESKRHLEALNDKVNSLECNLKLMLNECLLDQERLDTYKRQIQEMKQTMRLQRKASAESRDDNEKELVKLRLQRNLKQQSKQLALMGIKNELRSSLEELKAIKCRFSRQLINDS